MIAIDPGYHKHMKKFWPFKFRKQQTNLNHGAKKNYLNVQLWDETEPR